MNIIFAKHDGSPKPYAFSVPDSIKAYIEKGMEVLVETMHGTQMAQTTTGVICGDGALDVAKQNGAYEPLKPVISFVTPGMYTAMRAKIVKQIVASIEPNLPNAPADDADWSS